jgi:hypothetical protein
MSSPSPTAVILSKNPNRKLVCSRKTRFNAFGALAYYCTVPCLILTIVCVKQPESCKVLHRMTLVTGQSFRSAPGARTRRRAAHAAAPAPRENGRQVKGHVRRDGLLHYVKPA